MSKYGCYNRVVPQKPFSWECHYTQEWPDDKRCNGCKWQRKKRVLANKSEITVGSKVRHTVVNIEATVTDVKPYKDLPYLIKVEWFGTLGERQFGYWDINFLEAV